MRGAPEAEEVSCPKCGGKRLIRDYEHAEVICGDCGYVITDKLLDAGPDWRMMGRDKTKGRTGAPMTLSVDYSEPIVVEKEGEVRIVKIGEFVDSILENAESRRIGNVEIAEVQGYRTFAFDSDYHISLRPISSVSRHEVFEDLYEVELETGRRIRVTGAHSLFGVKGKEVVPMKVEELKEGDFIVVPRSFALQQLNFPQRLPSHMVKGIYTHTYPSVLAQLEDRIDPKSAEFDGGFPAVLNSTGREQFKTTSEERFKAVRVKNPDAIAALGFISRPPASQRKAALEELIPAPQEYRRLWKNRSRKRISRSLALSIAEKVGDEKLKKLAESPFAFLRVKKISRVKPSSKYAYDLSIPGCENFLCGRGWVFAHNSIHDKGLSTMIDWRDKDSYGKELTAGRRAQIYRLRKWQRRIRIGDAVDRNLTFALGEIERMTAHLGLPNDVKEAACHIYRKAVEERLIRGRSIEGVAAAALYAACRQWRIPRTLDEIAEVSRVSKKEIGRSYRFIIRQLMKTPSSSPVDYIPRFASELGLSGEVETKAIEILKKSAPYGLTSGRGPTGVAAAALYIATVLCNERRTQREIANVARVTEVTVRNRYKEIAEKLHLDVELD
jgi:transcription initiation factor TFIIB